MAFRNLLEHLRKARGLSQDALGELCNTNQSQIDRLEKGNRRLTIDWLLRLARALDVAPTAIVPELGEPALDAAEAELLACFRRVEPEQRAAVLTLLRAATSSSGPRRCD